MITLLLLILVIYFVGAGTLLKGLGILVGLWLLLGWSLMPKVPKVPKDDI